MFNKAKMTLLNRNQERRDNKKAKNNKEPKESIEKGVCGSKRNLDAILRVANANILQRLP